MHSPEDLRTKYPSELDNLREWAQHNAKRGPAFRADLESYAENVLRSIVGAYQALAGGVIYIEGTEEWRALGWSTRTGGYPAVMASHLATLEGILRTMAKPTSVRTFVAGPYTMTGDKPVTIIVVWFKHEHTPDMCVVHAFG